MTTAQRLPKGFALFPKRLLVEQGLFAGMVWAGFSLVMLIIPVVVSFFRPIEVSGWGFGLGIAQWYVLAIGCYVGWQMFELHVMHGQSRRGFLKSAFIFTLLFSALVAALCVVTFLPEALIYGTAGWPQVLDDNRLYDGPFDFPMLFLHGWLTFALYGAGGLFFGVAFYRNSALATLCVPAVLAVSWIAGLGMASTDGPLQFLVREGVVPSEPNALLATVLHVLCVAVLFGGAWMFGRDAAIRKKAA
ncbi:hypothetical protein [Devosia sediminis]|uniref:Uncharacterized protein n=1 Tax=Devosia sediminis TaxID=2798801 RepID=A0A934IVS0_9HYPH|nr:hypothetical protein [Devosia sediminis]MBJ3783207.1 hypothetical protein [Devosia sediminis]